jgi:hypothetical protein
VADRVRIRLEGGPCDGRNTTARVADFGPTFVVCQGVTYDPTSRTTKTGRLIYTTRASQQPPPTPTPTPTHKRSHAHGAWHHLMHTTFVRAPEQLQGVERAREAIRRLRHRRGLR